MTATIINRDVQRREFLMVSPSPNALAGRQEFTWSGQANGDETRELLLPGNEVLVPQRNVNYLLAGTFVNYAPFSPTTSEVTGSSEGFAGLRFSIRNDGTNVFVNGYNGFTAGAPGQFGIGFDLVPLPNVPETLYLRVRVRGFPGIQLNFGVFGRLFSTPRTR